MALSLEELITPVTKSEAFQTFLDLLEALEFPVTAWQSGNPGSSISDAVAELFAGARDTIPLIARGGYTKLATSDWLDLLIESQFADEDGNPLTRKAAIFTELKATLSADPAAGPHVIAVGQLTAQDGDGLRFTNITGGTLPLGGSLELRWKAETAGSNWVIPDNTLTQLVTPLAGVSINNPGPGSIVVVGADRETDAQYAARAPLQWAVLAEQAPTDTYRAWALKADEALRKVFVDDQNPGGPGTLWIWLANDSTTAQPSQITAVSNYIQPRRAIGSQLSYLAAPTKAVAVVATVYAKANAGLTSGQVEEKLTEFFKALDLGGETIPALGSNRVFLDRLEYAMRDASPGNVLSVVFSSPSGDVQLTPNELAVLSPAPVITVVDV